MTISLSGMGVLVTGANAGIGAEIARCLARAGARVALHYLEADGLASDVEHSVHGRPAAEAVCREILEEGGEAAILAGDLAREQDVAWLVAAAEGAVGPLQALINNAAHCGSQDSAFSTNWAEARRHFDVNTVAPLILMRDLVMRLRERGEGGRIVNISTDSARVFPGQVAYGSSKAALEALTRSAAVEFGPYGVTVNAVAPGPVQTGWMTEDVVRAVTPVIPARRVGTPDDIAGVVEFLLSPAAEWISGQVIQVAGGHAL
jgi:3-oxoacyl-[acyl-carrier protein] reductase